MKSNQTAEEALASEASGKFAGMNSRKSDQRVVLQKVLNLLGMTTSCG
jgi:hypothetical protein